VREMNSPLPDMLSSMNLVIAHVHTRNDVSDTSFS